MAKPAFATQKLAEKKFVGLARRGGQTAGRIKQLGPFRTMREAEAAAKTWSELPMGHVDISLVKQLKAI